ncbi:hypothetical protein LZ31DRAFT_264552 [Colletotrichum somersetense]|nr:hypothetical protein LZ31DRAFT_264552 [Colletotrichum somersetense]
MSRYWRELESRFSQPERRCCVLDVCLCIFAARRWKCVRSTMVHHAIYLVFCCRIPRMKVDVYQHLPETQSDVSGSAD